MCCNCCSVRQQKIWVFSIGSILTVLGIILIVGWPTWSEQLIESMMPLAPGSFIYNKWVTTPMPIYMSLYLYNWTNPEDFQNPNIKPNFQQMGPYTFLDFKVKQDLEWDDVTNTVTFRGLRTWWFEPEKSNGTLEDLITTPHFPSVAAAKVSSRWSRILRKIINFALNREGGALAMTHTASEWIFDGFYDDVFDIVERLHSPKFPVHSSHFGWFYERNNSKTAEGTYTVHTGKGDLTQMGDLKKWNGSDHTGNWDGECGRVNGSTGELWAAGKKWNDPVSVYIYEAARFLNVFPKENITYRGVEARRYESTDQTLDSGYVAPDTKCFCVKDRECPMPGAIDYSPIGFGAPVYMSHGNFYMADPLYRENTTGLRPDPELHGIHMVLEPKLGIPMSVKGQVMASIFVERNEMTDLFGNASFNFYAPLFEIVIEADIDDDLLGLVKFVLKVPSIGQYVGISLTVVGVIMLAVGIFVTTKHKWRGDVKPSDLAQIPDGNSKEMGQSEEVKKGDVEVGDLAEISHDKSKEKGVSDNVKTEKDVESIDLAQMSDDKSKEKGQSEDVKKEKDVQMSDHKSKEKGQSDDVKKEKDVEPNDPVQMPDDKSKENGESEDVKKD